MRDGKKRKRRHVIGDAKREPPIETCEQRSKTLLTIAVELVRRHDVPSFLKGTNVSSRIGPLQCSKLSMPLKKPRSPHAFITPTPWSVLRRHKTAVRPCRRHVTPMCAAVKLLVVELSEVLRDSSLPELKSFSERVSVDRNSTTDTTYLLYSSEHGYSRSMEQIKSAGLIEPDALSALDGTELYQRQYRTPDPYWAKMVCKDWDPKPTRWVINQFFGDTVNHAADDSEYYGLVFECRDRKQDRKEICKLIGNKLSEMGIKARVKERGESTTVVVTPAAGSVVEVVEFCQMMLRIPENMTFVFGADELVASCAFGKGNFGICAAGCERKWSDLGGRVFVSGKKGVEALVDGVMHYAVF